MSEPFRYISYGAGVQSTALLVMSVLGLKGVPRADLAVFADTGDEPGWVCETLGFYAEWAGVRGIPVRTVRKSESLSKDLQRAATQGIRYASVPAFTQGQDGREAITRRQCTREYKIEVIEKYVRQHLGVEPRYKVRIPVISMQGISVDECDRMKPSRTTWITNEWPLVEVRMNREDCKLLLAGLGLPVPKKSSCVFCPFHGDAYWIDLKRNHPKEFARACDVDRTIRGMSKRGMSQPLYIHRSLVPLSKVRFRHEQQRDFFSNECEGHCGV